MRLPVVPAKAGTERRWAVLLAAATLTACSSTGYKTLPTYWPIIPPALPAPAVVSDPIDGSTVDIVRTQMIRVHLPADTKAANEWTYELGKDAVLYPTDDTPRFLDAGTQEFTFRAEGTGTTSVRFTYHDPAQPQTPPARTLAFDVVAR
jgi:hypothetical protein